MAQLVEQVTLDFSSSHVLRVLGSSPVLGSTLNGGVYLGFFLSLCPCPALHPCTSSHTLSLPKNKIRNLKKQNRETQIRTKIRKMT